MASRRASRGSSHKPVRNHEEARLSCCAACGKGGTQLAVTPALQELIKRFAHPCYSVEVQSFPVGLCKYCKTCLYQCRSKGAAPREEWAAFKPEEVHIPRVPPGTDCQCAMCHTARFNPVGIKGEKKVVTSPVINTSGGPMECEVQERSVRKGQGVCEICLQITGRGIRHKCTAKERKEGQAGRGRSSHRLAANRRKRNLSVLVGREAESAQEQITSDALQRIRGIKGSNSFSMKSMSGGGIGGMGPEVKIGGGEEEQKVIGLELFTEVKKHLVKSKNKMERLCRIMRKHGVKMEPRVKEKLSLQDHKLDEHYETIKVEMTKTVTEEVPIDPNEKRRGRKSAKTTRKVKKEVTEEKDLTILKKPKEFLEKLAEDRFIWKGDVVHRISMDGGDNSFKIICNSFSKHGDPEITFTRTEEPGNLCSGVNRSIILAFVEGVQENHENLRVILELLQLDTLGFVVAADLKLLNVMLGLSGHGGKFACYICEGEIGLQPGVLRTISSLITHSKAYEDNGSKPATMQSFKNCVKPPLLDADEDALVMHLVPPPELHLLMGACNKGLEVLREALEKVGLEEKLWTWCSKHGVTRRGYNGKNKLDGNNSSSFLRQCEKLLLCDWFPVELQPVIALLQQLKVVKDKTFSWELEDGWEEAITTFTRKFSEMQDYCINTLGISLECSWKIHIIAAHLQPFLAEAGCGLARYAEQAGESIHAHLKPTLQAHRRKECHPQHGPRQQNAIAQYSANNL